MYTPVPIARAPAPPHHDYYRRKGRSWWIVLALATFSFSPPDCQKKSKSSVVRRAPTQQ